MLGITWAFFHQGVFGKKIGKVVFLYFAGLAAWYGVLYLVEKSKLHDSSQNSQINSEIIDDAEQINQKDKVIEGKSKPTESSKKSSELVKEK
jgi:hypothetical protein